VPYCQNCGAEIASGAKFCAECGAKISKQERKPKVPTCPKCGAEIESGEKFCSECGAKVSPKLKKAAAAKKKISAREAKSQEKVMDSQSGGIVFAEKAKTAPKETRDRKPKITFKIDKRKIMFLAGIAIIIVALVGIYMFVSSPMQTGVPVYPEATEATIQGMTIDDILSEIGQTLPTEWSAKMYQTTATAGALTNWYRSNMPGWTNVYDDMMEGVDFSMDILGFTKGSDAAFIVSISVLETRYFIIMEGPAADIQDIISGNF